MRGFGRTTIAGISFLALITILAACGGSEATVAPANTLTAIPPTDIPPTATRPAVLSFYGNLLAGIPDTPDTRKSVMINDYAAVREIFGVPLTGPEADQAALQEYFVSVRGSAHLAEGPFITGLNREAMGNSRRKYLAFDGRNVDQSVEAA